jgi:hypothetical protein
MGADLVGRLEARLAFLRQGAQYDSADAPVHHRYFGGQG